jgi:hypothetical protein
MERETATAHLSGQVWRQIVIVAAMVSALVAAVVAVTDRPMASEPGVVESRLEHPRSIHRAGSSSPSPNGAGSARSAGPSRASAGP